MNPRTMTFQRRICPPFLLPAAVGLVVMTGCTPLDINVGTEEPLDVDMSVNIHVYQFGPDDDKNQESKNEEDADTIDLAAFKAAVARRENREGDIWKIKGARLIGENHEGLLEVINESASGWGDYSRELVDAENDDRNLIMKHEAARQGIPIAEIRRREWQIWRLKTNAGEWIEEEDKETGKFRWTRKKDPPSSGE